MIARCNFDTWSEAYVFIIRSIDDDAAMEIAHLTEGDPLVATSGDKGNYWTLDSFRGPEDDGPLWRACLWQPNGGSERAV